MSLQPWRTPGEHALVPGADPEEITAGLNRALLDLYATATDFVWALRTWVLEIAPIVVAAHAKQALRDAIREFPFISPATKEGVLRWLRDHGL